MTTDEIQSLAIACIGTALIIHAVQHLIWDSYFGK